MKSRNRKLRFERLESRKVLALIAGNIDILVDPSDNFITTEWPSN